MSKKQKWVYDCIAYWETRIYEGDLGCDFSEAHERCWRCGYKRRVQKCHIIPKALGGKDTPDNLIPLCASCHDEAPDVLDPNEMWVWIRETCVPEYNTYWYLRGLSESKINIKDIGNSEDFIEDLDEILKGCSTHVSQGSGGIRIKTSTYAWALKQTYDYQKVKGIL